LEIQQTLDLFSYTGAMGARDKDKDTKKIPLPKSLEVFSTKPRTPVKKPAKWGRCTSQVRLSNNNLTATTIGSSAYQWVVTEETISKGKYEWKIKIDNMGHWMFFGVTNSIPTQDSSYSYTGSYGITCAQYVGKGGSLSSDTTCPKVTSGSTMSFLLDLTTLTLTITWIETKLSYIISGLPSGHPWYFQVNLYDVNNAVTFI